MQPDSFCQAALFSADFGELKVAKGLLKVHLVGEGDGDGVDGLAQRLE